MTASLCDAATDYDTTIHVYCGPCGSLRCIGGDDDGCPSASLKSTFSWCSAAGQEYLILVSGFSGETGSYQLTVAADGSCAPSSPCIDPPDTPVNDECADAIVITEGLVPFTTVNATTDGPDHPQCANQFDQGATPRDVWFLYTATMDGVLLLSTCEDLGGSATFDTDLVVYDPSLVAGSVCDNLEDALLGCNDDDPDNPCGGPPPDGGWQSTLYVPVVQGQPYLIRVGSGSTGGEGTGQLLVQSLPDGSDICSLALNIEPGQTVQLDTCTASPDPDVPVCGALPPDRPGRWLKTVGNGSQYTVTLCNLGFGAWNSRLLVYCGPCDDLVCAGGEPNNNSGCAPFTEKLTWCTEPGGEYYILVHGQANPGCGVIDVQLTSGAACSEPPCEQPLGACCVEGECVSNTSSANCVALNGQWYGDGSSCNALPTACRLPGGSCSGQNPTSPLGNWTFVPADLDAGFVGYDDFAWSGGQITALRFWGVDIFPQLGFIDCNESADGLVQFRVRIHANSGGQPGAVVFDAGVLSASRSPDGTFFDGFERNEYNIDLSSTPASLAAGTYWLSLAGADDDDDCWFYWSNSPTGGNNAVQEDVLTGPPFDPLSLNLSFCVNP